MERGDPGKLFRKYVSKLGIPLVIALFVMPFAVFGAVRGNDVCRILVPVSFLVLSVTGVPLMILGMIVCSNRLRDILEKRTSRVDDDSLGKRYSKLIAQVEFGLFSYLMGGCLCLLAVWIWKLAEREMSGSISVWFYWCGIVLLSFFILQLVMLVGLHLRLRSHRNKVRSRYSTRSDSRSSGDDDGAE